MANDHSLTGVGLAGLAEWLSRSDGDGHHWDEQDAWAWLTRMGFTSAGGEAGQAPRDWTLDDIPNRLIPTKEPNTREVAPGGKRVGHAANASREYRVENVQMGELRRQDR